MTQTQTAGEQLGWLLDNLVSRVANVREALVLSRDGLVVAMSQTMSREHISEIRPLRTEEVLSDRSIGVDDVEGAGQKTTTTVAMDFGRITVRADLTLYLFGTPGQERFWFMWDEMAYGAIGAVVLADTQRLNQCFAAVDYFEQRAIPFLVAVNCFDGAPVYEPDEVRAALDLRQDTPVVLCDARQRESVKQVLVAVVSHALHEIRVSR
jgi:signal recognition particle receptor subunit beta